MGTSKKGIIIVSAAAITLFAANAAVNTYIASEIEEKVKETLVKIEDEGGPREMLTYGDISYSWISSTATFEDLEIEMDGGGYLRAEEFQFAGDPKAFPSMEDMKAGNIAGEFEDVKLAFSELRLKNEEMTLTMGKGACEIDARLTADEEFFFRNLRIHLDDASLLAEGDALKVGSLQWSMESEQEVNLMALEDGLSGVKSVEDFGVTFDIKDFELPSNVADDMDLDEFGIVNLEGSDLNFAAEKVGDEMNLDLFLDSRSVGQIDLGCSFDLSQNPEDPELDLVLEMDHIKGRLFEMFSELNLEKVGDHGFRFAYAGKASAIGGALN